MNPKKNKAERKKVSNKKHFLSFSDRDNEGKNNEKINKMKDFFLQLNVLQTFHCNHIRKIIKKKNADS